MANTTIGLANAEGGLIVVGLWGGTTEGIDRHPRRVAAWQQAPIDFTVPVVPSRTRRVPCINDRGGPDHLLVVEVEPSESVHANRRDEVFLRVGDETRRLTFAQRQELLYDKGQATFESTPVPGCTVADLDAGALASYGDAVGHRDPQRLLTARGLLPRSRQVTTAAALLFAEHPQTWFPEAAVRVLRYQGTERGTGSRQRLLDDVRIE
ncbi:MAG: helix-turn-helix domain-containing protein, partial [Actinomycetota bacterium]